MKKALMYASVASMIQQFNMNNISLLQELGYKVDVACNFEFGSTITNEKIEKLKDQLIKMNVNFYQIPVPRKITDIKNLRLSYKMTKDLINEKKYDLIHCHSPIGGIICRLANKHSKHYDSTRMIYTAHGFHFFKGNNPLKNFLFRNIERYGAKSTDTLITINKEDYAAAKKFKLKKNGTVEYVPGVGIDIDKINSIQGNKEELCKELNIPVDTILLLSVGELSKRKNHEVIVRLLNQLPDNIHYVICGQGQLENYLLDLAQKLKVNNRLHLLGYRTNIPQIMKSCDIFVFPSLQEGLPVALMEAMACGLPCVASEIRGNIDLIEDGVNSSLCNPIEYKEFLNSFKSINKEIGDKFGKLNIIKIKKYDIKKINIKMNKIYEEERK